MLGDQQYQATHLVQAAELGPRVRHRTGLQSLQSYDLSEAFWTQMPPVHLPNSIHTAPPLRRLFLIPPAVAFIELSPTPLPIHPMGDASFPATGIEASTRTQIINLKCFLVLHHKPYRSALLKEARNRAFCQMLWPQSCKVMNWVRYLGGETEVGTTPLQASWEVNRNLHHLVSAIVHSLLAGAC